MEVNVKKERFNLLYNEGVDLKNRINNGFFKLDGVEDSYINECVDRAIEYTLVIDEIKDFSDLQLTVFFHNRVRFLINNKDSFNEKYISDKERVLRNLRVR